MQKFLEKTPPNDLGIERALLKCMLYNAKCIDSVKTKITADDFYREFHKVLFTSLTEYSAQKGVTEIDIKILGRKLQAIKPAYLNEIIELEADEYFPSETNIERYISQIKNLSVRRKQMELGIKIFNAAYNENIDTNATIEEIKQCLEKATHKDDTGIVQVSDIYDDIDKLYHQGLNPGLSTGWKTLDDCYTVRPGEITIITGIPSHGKSAWNTNLMVNIANHYGWKFAVFSPENQPVARHVVQIMQIYVGRPFRPGYHERIMDGEMEYAKDWINNHFVFIVPHDDELKIDSLINKAITCVLKYGIKGIVLDPWNEIDHTRPSNLTETEYISKCLTKLRYFARTYQVHVWLIAHPTKLMKRLDGQYPVPTPYDISGSAHFRNKADCCLSVWRNMEPDYQGKEVEIYIQKIRFSEVGKIGKVVLNFDPMTQRYLE